MVFVAHSYLETIKSQLIFNNNSTADNFRETKINNEKCNVVFETMIEQYDYELSFSQLQNAINLLLTSNKQ